MKNMKISDSQKLNTNKHSEYRSQNDKSKQFSEVLQEKTATTGNIENTVSVTPGPKSLEVPSSFVGQQKLHWTQDPLKKDELAKTLLPEDKESGLPMDRHGRIHRVKPKNEKSESFGYNPPPDFKMPRKMKDYEGLIIKYANKYGLDPNLVAGVIKQESGFNPKARSYCGAMGLMQLMPSTAKNLGVTNPYDPEDNINGGCKYLRQMLDRFGGNTRLAVASYNAGPGNVEKYGNRVPPFAETQNYVRSIASHVKGFMVAKAFSTTGSNNETA